MRGIRPRWLGRLGYEFAWKMQHARRQAVLAGRAPEAFWLLEHDPVITTGRRDAGRLASDLPVIHTERGGLATWHGPGQLVGYLIVDVAARGLGVKRTIAGIEQGVIDWLGGAGVEAMRRPGYPGVWVRGSKVCAVGMHFRRGVSMHGFALNLTADLSVYDSFVPCGIRDAGVSSLEGVLGRSPSPEEASAGVAARVVDTLGLGG